MRRLSTRLPALPAQHVHSTLVTLNNPSASQLDLLFEAPISARRIWPVRELVDRVRQLVEQQLGDLWVEGEISNLRAAPSGHLYFTLKDAEAQLPIVLFRRQALLLRFRPADGLHVLVRGRVSIYEQRGQLQLVAETMEPVGAGSLQLAFEQLKDRLRAEGLFDADRKRVLPAFPCTVGIVTSPTGAVIRDFLNVVGRRHSALHVLLYPVSVQGESALAEIATAIADLDASGLVDLIVLARGGGSLEDLAAFNSERVARAIAASALPVVSAVGHETDFTIADFVADLRAPTPSAAAELITEAQHRIAERLESHNLRLERAMRYQWMLARKRMDSIAVNRLEARFAMLFRRLEQRRDDLSFRVEASLSATLRERQRAVSALAASVLRHDPRRRLSHEREQLSHCSTRLERQLERITQRSAAQLQELDVRLQTLSPLAVLERGYALVQGPDGALIRSAAQLALQDLVTTRVSKGSFTSRVEELHNPSSQMQSGTKSGTKSRTKNRTDNRKDKK
ncbi:MAG TPA: exodeoxyribonuclease VII large subunit [Terracidiphilus sp.]|nr:exodeoxyribonuclease VII large subunit [Terracidiphilus sp.]